jgi:hypothetical protein
MSRLFAFREVPAQNAEGASVETFAGFVVAEDARTAKESIREEYEVSGEIEVRRFKGAPLIFVVQSLRVEEEPLNDEEDEDTDEAGGAEDTAEEGEETLFRPVVDLAISGEAAEVFLGFIGVDIESLIEEVTDDGEVEDDEANEDEDEGEDDDEAPARRGTR